MLMITESFVFFPQRETTKLKAGEYKIIYRGRR
jgi:hypothetical protein